MNHLNSKLTLGAVIASAVAVNGHAAISYVDADVASNTTLADGTALVAGSVGYSTSVATDNLWNLRGFGNDGTIFGSNDNSGNENAPRLRTTISGLTAGESYDIYSYFWGSNGGARWRGRVSLTDDAGDLPGYNTNHFTTSSFDPMSYVTENIAGSIENPGPLSPASTTGGDPQFEDGGYFSNAVMTEESNRALYEVALGPAVADANGEIAVYIDDLMTGDQFDRTWYDGVGYEIVPEPASAALLVMGVGLIAGRRRRA